MTRAPRLLPSLLLLLAAAATAAAQAPPDALLLRPGDAVRVTVRDEPTLGGEFPVVPPGEVLLPEIGAVRVADRPFAEVEREVRARFARILVDPEMALVPVLRIAVLGEVQQPGLFPVDPSQTVADVLASAGGVTLAGDARDVVLVRDGRRTRLDLSPGSPPPAEGLRSGDRIEVGRRGWLRENGPVVVSAGASVAVALLSSLILR
jgi:polysaccharide biosynthesis/export protein